MWRMESAFPVGRIQLLPRNGRIHVSCIIIIIIIIIIISDALLACRAAAVHSPASESNSTSAILRQERLTYADVFNTRRPSACTKTTVTDHSVISCYTTGLARSCTAHYLHHRDENVQNVFSKFDLLTFKKQAIICGCTPSFSCCLSETAADLY